ncbi:MAG: DUF6883 domain-containing protein [Gammaproteobacteria bacterium]
MKLPNAEHALIPTEKVRDYLLSSSHPVGRFKAVFFRALGYMDGDWERLEGDIRSVLTNDATVGERTEYGQKLEVRGGITGPTGRSTEIVTAWIILKGESIPRFITAYPGD